jgi:hypothetical protein
VGKKNFWRNKAEQSGTVEMAGVLRRRPEMFEMAWGFRRKLGNGRGFLGGFDPGMKAWGLS